MKTVKLTYPLYTHRIPAGFPSPADDHLEPPLNLDEHLIAHPSATFFCRVEGDSMTGLGIFNNDLLIVDRALNPNHGDVIIAAIDGQMTCKQLDMQKRRLLPANPLYSPISIHTDSQFSIEGIVTHSIRYHRPVR